MRVVVAGCVLACALAFAPEARADFDFQLAIGTNARWMRATPTLTTPPLLTSARDLPDGKVPMRGGQTMLGGYVDVALTIDDRWVVPMLGAAAYHAAGTYDAVITSRDGSIVRARPWTTFSADILLPGLGYRVKKRRWMFGAALRTGVSWLAMEGVMASGAEADPIELSASTFFVQAELEGCRRLDPTTRVCLLAAPRVYDHQLMNGALFGLRVEWGR